MTAKRRHHYLPKSYIAGFCNEPRRIYLYDALEDAVYPSSPRDAFVQANYNTVPTAEGGFDHNSVENLLEQEIETPGIAAIRRYIASGSCTADDRLPVARFAALQMARVPVFRRGVEELARASVTQAFRRLDRRGLFPDLPKSLKAYGASLSELVEKGVIRVDILPHYSLTGLASVESTTEYLAQMNWCLLDTAQSDYFPVSDNPIAVYDPYFRQGARGIGLAYPNVEVTFPLDKYRCLLATWNPLRRDSVEIPRRALREVNRRIGIFGDRFYGYPIYSEGIRTMIRNYAGRPPSTQVEIIPADSGSYLFYRIDFPTSFLESQYINRLSPLYPSIS